MASPDQYSSAATGNVGFISAGEYHFKLDFSGINRRNKYDVFNSRYQKLQKSSPLIQNRHERVLQCLLLPPAPPARKRRTNMHGHRHLPERVTKARVIRATTESH